jgi:hypothetical protein
MTFAASRASIIAECQKSIGYPLAAHAAEANPLEAVFVPATSDVRAGGLPEGATGVPSIRTNKG